MKAKVLSVLFFVVIIRPFAYAQIGSNASFEFLNLNISARNTALGGLQTTMSLDSGSVKESNQWLVNPAYSDSTLSQFVSLSYLSFYANVKYGTFTYIHDFHKYGVWALGVQYLDYGKLESFDISGLPLGEFSAQDYALVLNHSHQIGFYRLGANIKVATSHIAGYRATALLADIGGAFVHPTQDFTASLLFSNLGFLLSDYTVTSHSRLPTDVRLGLTFKPQYMPFRFHMSVYKILQDTHAYYRFNEEEPGLANKVFRHLTFGGEILLSPHFNVRVGYNHLIKSTLQLQQVTGGAGLSFGFMLRLKALQLDFARGYYHVSGGFSHLTMAVNLNQLIFSK